MRKTKLEKQRTQTNLTLEIVSVTLLNDNIFIKPFYFIGRCREFKP